MSGMGILEGALNGLRTIYAGLFTQPDWRNYLDIIIIAFLIYELIRLVLRTRASAVLKGIGVFLAITWLFDILQLNVVSWAFQQFLDIGVILVVVLFQPELRGALERLGRTSIIASSTNTDTGSVSRDVSELVQAMSNMSRKRIGALIVIEGKTGLREFADTGTMINADISSGLIENIFEPNTPLHDGATIIRNRRVLASACILQLSNNPEIAKELGTRHRAAIGVTETTDAISLIVSEETGVISVAREGRISRNLDVKTLTEMLTELFTDGSTNYFKKLGKRLQKSKSASSEGRNVK